MSREYFKTHFPHESETFNQVNIDDFFNFMFERHCIWQRRFIEKLPREQWTNDPVLKVTKYTNIYRELDRGTLYFLQFVFDRADDLKRMLWKNIIYRLCNRIETFEEVGFPSIEDYDNTNINNKWWEKLEVIRLRGEPCMTSAHLTCPTPPGYTKVEGFVLACNDLHKKLDKLVEDVKACQNSREVFLCLKNIHCVGDFIAYEVLCDLMYNKVIGRWETVGVDNFFRAFMDDDWANVGPGAKVGIRLLYPSTKGGKNIYGRMVELRDQQHVHWERLKIAFPWYEKFSVGHLSLRSVEHSLCEFQKFWLQKNKLGKQRMIFNENKNKVVNGKRLIVDPNCGDRLIYQEEKVS